MNLNENGTVMGLIKPQVRSRIEALQIITFLYLYAVKSDSVEIQVCSIQVIL